jgi:3-hydroxyacyl-CoA dehydrogenase
MQEQIQTVAVIGCGVIGSSWATLFLSRGLNVIIFDPAESAQEIFKQYLKDAWPALQACGVVEDSWAMNYKFVDDVESSLLEADFVQEVPNKALKYCTRGVNIANQ